MGSAEAREREGRVDGRSERRRRGRQAVVDATIALIEELERPPSADEVAERAGVSAATLFRYFTGLDELRTEAIARFAERTAHLNDIPGRGEGDLDARIASVIDSRIRMYQTVAPVARFARARAAEQALLAAVVQARRDAVRTELADHFSTELAGLADDVAADLVHTTAALTSFESWDLSTAAGRSDAEISRAWTRALRVLLAGGSVEQP